MFTKVIVAPADGVRRSAAEHEPGPPAEPDHAYHRHQPAGVEGGSSNP